MLRLYMLLLKVYGKAFWQGSLRVMKKYSSSNINYHKHTLFKCGL